MGNDFLSYLRCEHGRMDSQEIVGIGNKGEDGQKEDTQKTPESHKISFFKAVESNQPWHFISFSIFKLNEPIDFAV